MNDTIYTERMAREPNLWAYVMHVGPRVVHMVQASEDGWADAPTWIEATGGFYPGRTGTGDPATHLEVPVGARVSDDEAVAIGLRAWDEHWSQVASRTLVEWADRVLDGSDPHGGNLPPAEATSDEGVELYRDDKGDVCATWGYVGDTFLEVTLAQVAPDKAAAVESLLARQGA